MTEPKGPTEDEMNDLADDLLGIVLPEGSGARLITRALELWGRPAIEPVPVGERLPGLKDCDTKGRCWFIDDDEKWCPVILGDILDEDEPDAIQRVIYYYGYTHWVQGWALPVPTREALELLEELPALAQPEPVGRPWPVPGDAEGLAEVFWGNYDQFDPEALEK